MGRFQGLSLTSCHNAHEFIHRQVIMAMPYDTPVPGFNNNVIALVRHRRTLIAWSTLLGCQHPSTVECQGATKIQLSILCVCLSRLVSFFDALLSLSLVNDGDYLQAVSEQSLAENVTRVLYPNDNVSSTSPSLSIRHDDLS